MTIHPMGSAADRLRSLAAERDEVFLQPSRLMAIAIGAGILAALLTALVFSGSTLELDRWLFDRIYLGAIAAGPLAWLWEAVRDVTALGSTVVLVGAVAVSTAYLLAARRARLAMLLLASAIGATIVNSALKWGVSRSRPELTEQLVATYTASFPSGHALLSVAIILSNGGIIAFAARRRQERVVIIAAALGLGVLVGTSRVLLGVHWPSDVLAGWLMGIAWAALTLWVATRTDTPGQPR